MKNIIISLKLSSCKQLVNGEKTVDIRMTKPKMDGPFKCYIYETKDQNLYSLISPPKTDTLFYSRGKIIGEFICNQIDKYEAEFTDDNCLNSINKISLDDNGDECTIFETSNEFENPSDCILCKNSCTSFEFIKHYIFKSKSGIFNFYGWNISDLKIYDTPKELSEFGLTRAPQNWAYLKSDETANS